MRATKSGEALPTRQWPSVFRQMLIFCYRSFVQQSHGVGEMIVDVCLLVGIGLLVGLVNPKDTKTQFELMTLVIGLTSIVSALRIVRVIVIRRP